MENCRSYEEGYYYSQNSIPYEQDFYLRDEENFVEAFNPGIMLSFVCTCCDNGVSNEAPLHGDIFKYWPDLEEGAHHKGEQVRREVGADAGAKKHEGSEETVFSSTQHLRSTTSSPQSCLSLDSSALEGNHHKGEKHLKQELNRDAGEKKREWRLSNGPEETPFTFEVVAQYFCMPVKQAAEELNVGLTHLKKRCREVGIPRWPHRKVKSLETLIKNAQELGMPKIEVERLRQMKKLIEERPGHVELDQKTMVLRQACFKEKFKRRRLMEIQG
ncbi:uncharacterized protein [Lolium perenne]|uniref:uncharacterized protein n=1 Tax=Lolium perenne TaxID=4522 RepID=UPI0021F5C71F|nr:protein RKD4-like [Lolium perenne]